MIQAENELPAETWFFKIIVRLDDDRDFSDVLNARKQQLERSLSTVSVISWAAMPLHPRNQSLNIWELEESRVLCTTVLRTKFDWDA